MSYRFLQFLRHDADKKTRRMKRIRIESFAPLKKVKTWLTFSNENNEFIQEIINQISILLNLELNQFQLELQGGRVYIYISDVIYTR